MKWREKIQFQEENRKMNEIFVSLFSGIYYALLWNSMFLIFTWKGQSLLGQFIEMMYCFVCP